MAIVDEKPASALARTMVNVSARDMRRQRFVRNLLLRPEIRARCTLACMRISLVLGIAALVAACAGRQVPPAPNEPAPPSRAVAATPTSGSDSKPPDAAAARAFLLQLLDAARREDSAAWSVLQSQRLRARDLKDGVFANLRRQAWANDLGRLEDAIRTGRVFTMQHGGVTAINVEPTGQRARAVASVAVEDHQFRLDEN